MMWSGKYPEGGGCSGAVSTQREDGARVLWGGRFYLIPLYQEICTPRLSLTRVTWTYVVILPQTVPRFFFGNLFTYLFYLSFLRPSSLSEVIWSRFMARLSLLW